ncbi:hypothetical protein BDM02DRAFT_1278294 [Thelephora ganbajun]|uniref:Uncharacterized protein n=1 Tax=Thelephora ganbajun TaxID=370292 RepID=A0ACB6Z331_THEGA|nr:hypothetical protein BDM02DRAFT_1278294 [Thelephora ganbajun]
MRASINAQKCRSCFHRVHISLSGLFPLLVHQCDSLRQGEHEHDHVSQPGELLSLNCRLNKVPPVVITSGNTHQCKSSRRRHTGRQVERRRRGGQYHPLFHTGVPVAGLDAFMDDWRKGWPAC